MTVWGRKLTRSSSRMSLSRFFVLLTDGGASAAEGAESRCDHCSAVDMRWLQRMVVAHNVQRMVVACDGIAGSCHLIWLDVFLRRAVVLTRRASAVATAQCQCSCRAVAV